MKKVHFVLQGKGGIGKSVVAAFIAQYKKQKGENVICLDIDPVNKTLSAYKSFDAIPLKIMETGNIISKKFDVIIQNILDEKDENANFVLDNGSSSFVAFSNYLLENDIGKMLVDEGCLPIIHIVLVGGQAQNDTLSNFSVYPQKFGLDYKYVAWVNPFWGVIEVDGRIFEESYIFQQNKQCFDALIKFPIKTETNRDTYGLDFSKVLLNHQTLDEAIADPSFTLMERKRLKDLKTTLFQNIETGFTTMGIE